MTIRHQFCYV